MSYTYSALSMAFRYLVLSLALSTSSVAIAEKKELIFGSVAMDIPAAMHKRLTPLTQYLAKQLDMPVRLRLSPDMGSAIEETASGRSDISYLTPVAYLDAHTRGNAKLIVKTVTRGKGFFKLMIVVAQNSTYRTVSDLVGKRFAFGDEKALLQRAVVTGSGIKLEEFSEYKFIGHYDNIARAVKIGDFDAGIVKDTTAYKWEGNGLRILHSSDQLPPYNIAASSQVPDEMVARLKKAFLDLDGNNASHLAIIKALDRRYDGFSDTSDAEYDIVRTLVRPFR